MSELSKPEYLASPVTCPECGYEMDGVSGVNGASHPDDGSISLCMQCGKISVFALVEDGKFRLDQPTAEVEREVLEDPEVRRIVALIQSSEYQAGLLLSRLNMKD